MLMACFYLIRDLYDLCTQNYVFARLQKTGASENTLLYRQRRAMVTRAHETETELLLKESTDVKSQTLSTRRLSEMFIVLLLRFMGFAMTHVVWHVWQTTRKPKNAKRGHNSQHAAHDGR